MLKKIYILLLVGIVMSIMGCSGESDLSEINSAPTTDSAYAIPTENTSGTPEEIDIIEKSNNTSRAYDLITKTYPEEVLMKFYEKDMLHHTPMTALNAECEIECIRKIDDNKYYTIHSSDSGGILYSLFSKDNNGVFKLRGSTDDAVHTWYVKKIITNSDFEKLKTNSSTLKDVKNIDMYGLYSVDLAPHMGRVMEQGGSFHLTADGYEISVIYDIEDECVVTDVTIEKADKNSFYGYLLEMDRPENLLNSEYVPDNVNAKNAVIYTEDDFVNLKSGTSYDEVIKKYGGVDDGWGNLIYTLENGKTLRVSFSVDKEVLFVETRQGNEFDKCYKWIEREKSENNGKSDMRHAKTEFDTITEGMSFDEVVNKLGADYTLIGNGFIIAKYLTEDFDWAIIGCGQHNKVKGVSFSSK